MKRIAIISIALIFFMLGCKDNSVEPPPTEYEPLIPLSVGNYWLYRRYELNSDGTGGTPSQWKFGFIIQNPTIQLPGEINSSTYQMSRCSEDLVPFDDTGFTLYAGNKLVYQNASGFYYSGIVRKDTLVMTFNNLIFPYPTEKGRLVNGHVFYYNNSGNTSNVPDEASTQYICVSTDSLFTTPLGDFRCIVYKMAWQDYSPLFRDEVYYFIKPGLGIVGMVNIVFHHNNNKYSYIRKILLTDYQIKEGDKKWKSYLLFLLP